MARPCCLSTCSAADVRSAVASRSHCATAPSTLTTRRPPALLVSSDSAALISATPRRLNVSINVARSATLRVHRSSLAVAILAARGGPPVKLAYRYLATAPCSAVAAAL